MQKIDAEKVFYTIGLCGGEKFKPSQSEKVKLNLQIKKKQTERLILSA